MARFHVSAVAAVLCILTLGLGASRSASQKEGFQSINCGGGNFTDPNTTLHWEEDPFNKNINGLLNGRASKVQSSYSNTTFVMTTLRSFPSDKKNRKFCYLLEVSNGNTYLLRASFLYGNYDGLKKPPTFLLIFNYDIWANVTTSLSSTPIMHELTFNAHEDNNLNICVSPLPHQNYTPFISTIELRLLNISMYSQNSDALHISAIGSGFGLMLWKRINYGTRTKAAIRYPNDEYDRIWEANTTGPTLSINTSNVGISYVVDATQPPAAVLATAIESRAIKENLTFTYEGYGGVNGFRMDLHFEELDEKVRLGQSGPRQLGLVFPNSGFNLSTQAFPIEPAPGAPNSFFLDQLAEFPPNLQLTLYPWPGSPLGPLLNAIELFFWTPQPLSTNGTSPGDVAALTLIQEYFEITGSGQGDPCMPKGYEWTWIKCNGGIPPKIIQINLASFNLTGNIPPFINNLTSLQRVDLSHNMLFGQIPDLKNLQDLQYLDVSFNNLCGSLRSSLPTSVAVTYNYTGNSQLCDVSTCQCNSSLSSNNFIPSTNNNNPKKYIFAISFMGALYVILLLILFIFYKTSHNRRKEEAARSSMKEKKQDDELKGLPYLTKIFTYNEINNATLNFTTLLGEGGFGKVYHGLLPTGEAIAVKLLANVSKQSLKEFYNEVAILSRVRHKNLVSFLGYCVEDTYMLIYEYVAKGNLKDLLYGDVESTDKPLPWKTRLHIALDASQGLDYLHTGCDPAIIHRDVKTSNILLSDKMQAKVSDFGLSRLKEGDTVSHVSTHNVVGTPGYLDPAYNATNQLTDKSDVYSFGVVLLELICGRAPIDMFTSPPYIVEWAQSSIMQGKVGDIMDPMLANGCRVESMWKVVDLAFGCVDGDRMKRPKMSQISQVLRDSLEIELDQSSTPSSKNVSGTSSTPDEKIPTLQYIKNIQMMLEPR